MTRDELVAWAETNGFVPRKECSSDILVQTWNGLEYSIEIGSRGAKTFVHGWASRMFLGSVRSISRLTVDEYGFVRGIGLGYTILELLWPNDPIPPWIPPEIVAAFRERAVTSVAPPRLMAERPIEVVRVQPTSIDRSHWDDLPPAPEQGEGYVLSEIRSAEWLNIGPSDDASNRVREMDAELVRKGYLIIDDRGRYRTTETGRAVAAEYDAIEAVWSEKFNRCLLLDEAAGVFD